MRYTRLARHAFAPLLIALVATAASGGASPASAATDARLTTGGDAPPVRIVRPRRGERVSGAFRPKLRVARSVRRLELRVNGRLRLSWSARAGAAPLLRTKGLANGLHTIEIRAIGRGASVRRVQRVRVANATARSLPRRPATPAPRPSKDVATPVTAPVESSTGLPVAPAPPPASSGALDLPGTILRSGDFNTGNLSQWSGYQQVGAHSLNVVRSPAREGAYAARFEVRNGDDPLCMRGWGCYGDRAEVQMSTGEAEGQERWYSWSTMIGADFPRSSAWQVISQWHADAEGSPPIGFYAENDDLVLRFHRHSGPGQLMEVVNAWRGSLRRGQWQDIKLHVKWSASDSVGFVELWIDGVPQTFDRGGTRRYVRNLYPGGIGNYFKQGLYRKSGVAQTGVVHHDGFRMSRP